MVSLYRPVTLLELTSLVDLPSISSNLRRTSRVVELRGSFLTIRNNVIYFVHQSAKDFLLKDAIKQICRGGQGARSLPCLSTCCLAPCIGMSTA